MGERKKAYIAFALACNADILLLDEPTNGLDIPSKTTLRRLLAAYADEKRTILISTHQVREVENLIDNIIILDEQGLALAATTEELTRSLTFGSLSPGSKSHLLRIFAYRRRGNRCQYHRHGEPPRPRTAFRRRQPRPHCNPRNPQR